MSWLSGHCVMCAPRKGKRRYGYAVESDSWQGWKAPGDQDLVLCADHIDADARVVSLVRDTAKCEAWAQSGICAHRVMRATVELGKGPHLDLGKVLALEPDATTEDVHACRVPGSRWRAGTTARKTRKERRDQYRYYATATQLASLDKRSQAGLGDRFAALTQRADWCPVPIALLHRLESDPEVREILDNLPTE